MVQHPSKKNAATVAANGDKWADPFEISRVRRDDYIGIKKGETNLYDSIQHDGSLNRGHQFAAAFLTVTSGLSKHGLDSDKPLPYSHFDIAGSACENTDYVHGKTTGSTIATLTATFVLPKLQAPSK